MEYFEDRIAAEEKTPTKKKWSPPTRKKIKTSNTMNNNTNGGVYDGADWPTRYESF